MYNMIVDHLSSTVEVYVPINTTSYSSSDVLDLILNAMSSLVELRKEEGQWVDQDNPDAGIVMSCEGLESLLIPAFSVAAPEVLEVVSEAEDLIHEDVLKLMDTVGEQGFLSTPYSRDKNGIVDNSEGKEDRQTIDSTSFYISTLLHYFVCFDEYLKKNPKLKSKVKEQINYGLDTMVGAKVQQEGWSWDIEGKCAPNLYFTWTALETVVDVLDSHSGYNKRKQLIDMKEKAISWIKNGFIEEVYSGEKIDPDIDGMPVDIFNYYYNIYALVSLLTCEFNLDHAKVSHGLNAIIQEYKPAYKRLNDKDYNIVIASGCGGLIRDADILDRSFLPLLTKATALHLSSSNRSQSELEPELHYLIGALEENISRSSQYSGMWAGSRHSIYYTERAIEALCRVYSYLKKGEKKAEVDSSKFIQLLIPRDSMKQVVESTMGSELNLQSQPTNETEFKVVSTRIDQIGQKVNKHNREIDKLQVRVKALELELDAIEDLRKEFKEIREFVHSSEGKRR